MCAESLQLCLTLCDPMACRLLSFSVHGILQEDTGVGLPGWIPFTLGITLKNKRLSVKPEFNYS